MEESISTLLITGILCAIGGIGLGTALTLWWSPSSRKYQDLENRLTAQQNETKTYQHEVTEHFSQTAELLGNLAHSYLDVHNNFREVHNHLAQGAQDLCADGTKSSPILEKLTTVLAETNTQAADTINIPLDPSPSSALDEQDSPDQEFDPEKAELSETGQADQGAFEPQSQELQGQLSPDSEQTPTEQTTTGDSSNSKETTSTKPKDVAEQTKVPVLENEVC